VSVVAHTRPRAVLAGLLAAGSTALVLCPAPLRRPLPLSALLAVTAGYMCFIAAACGATMLWKLRRRRVRRDRRLLLRAVVASLWFACAAIFAFENSGWALLACIAPVAAGFSLFPSPPQARSFGVSLAAGVMFEAAVLCAIAHHNRLGAVLAMTAAALFASRWTFRRRPAHSFAMTILALAVSVTGMLRYLEVHRGSGSAGSAAAGADAQTEPDKRGTAGGINKIKADTVWRGVILVPEVQQHTILVPPLPAMASSLFKSNRDNPLSIPFYGVYWYLKAPDRRPPPDVYTVHGDAASMTFRSTDGAPLSMEAHQNLGKLIDLKCCDRIEVTVDNADHYFGTVSLELILVNTTLPGNPCQPLGRRLVTSMPRSTAVDGKPFIAERLSFDLPATPAIRQFDELTIRFHLESLRADRGARIGIERFTLVPRGSAGRSL
jgi:hypothetical protein